MVPSDKTVGCHLAERLHEPDVEYWRSSTSQQELLSKPPHEAKATEAIIKSGTETAIPFCHSSPWVLPNCSAHTVSKSNTATSCSKSAISPNSRNELGCL